MADSENVTFKTAKVVDNEIVKAEDFTFGFDSLVENIDLFSKMIFDTSKDFVIGGKVVVDSGTNVKVKPVFGVSTDTNTPFGMSADSDLLSITQDDSNSRIDIIQAKGEWVDYDTKQRAFNDLDTNTITYQDTETKSRVKVTYEVKRGVNNSNIAPDTDEGYVKIAEIHYTAGTTELTEDDIYNITADTPELENDDWTNEKDRTYNLGYISDVNLKFRVDHNQDGSHKAKIIKSSNIDFGNGSTQVDGSKIPIGGTAQVIGSVEYPATSTLDTLFKAICDQLATVADVTTYTNNLLSRYEYVSGTVDLATTGKITLSGEQYIDNKLASANTIVLVKDQENNKGNGIYIASNTNWVRVDTSHDYSTFDKMKYKLFVVSGGTVNTNKIFYSPTEDIAGTLAEDSIIAFSEYKKINTQQLADSSVTSSKLGSDLILKGNTYGTFVGNIIGNVVGNLVGETSSVNKTWLINAVYPVGSLYWSSNSTNPGTVFGVGTWTQIKDKFVLSAGDTYVAGDSGGSATKTLSVANLPSHNHSCSTDGSHSHSCSTENTNHTHYFTTGDMSKNSTGSFSFNKAGEAGIPEMGGSSGNISYTTAYHKYPDTYSASSNTLDTLSIDVSHTHSGNTDSSNGENSSITHSHTIGSEGSHSHTIGSTGTGTALNIMPPYVVKYCWERTS